MLNPVLGIKFVHKLQEIETQLMHSMSLYIVQYLQWLLFKQVYLPYVVQQHNNGAL